MRQPQTNAADSVREVFAKLSGLDRGLQRARGSADEARHTALCVVIAIAIQTDLANQFLLGRRSEVSHVLKIDGSTLTVASSQNFFAGFTTVIDLKRLRGAARKNMNARRRRRLAGTVLGHHQHGNVILRQLADHGFDGAHAGADALDPDTSAAVLRCSSSCQDFGSVQVHTLPLYYSAAKTVGDVSDKGLHGLEHTRCQSGQNVCEVLKQYMLIFQ